MTSVIKCVVFILTSAAPPRRRCYIPSVIYDTNTAFFERRIMPLRTAPMSILLESPRMHLVWVWVVRVAVIQVVCGSDLAEVGSSEYATTCFTVSEVRAGKENKSQVFLIRTGLYYGGREKEEQ
ncbi:hypothetical protein V8E53_007062 [Lactarius tabidus]